LKPDECVERISLTEVYSRRVTDFARRRESLLRAPLESSETERGDLETARADCEKAWLALEQHIAGHRCLQGLIVLPTGADLSSQILEGAARDVILVTDNDRRFVDVSEAAAGVLGLPRLDIAGRRIEEFFSEARGQSIEQAFESFVTEGAQCGVCELRTSGPRRLFEYRAKADFAPGLHLAVLREISVVN
jgi:PAS domain-containing protein